MKKITITFTEKQLDLIGDCVLAAVIQLNKAWKEMSLEHGRIALQEEIVKCNNLLTEIAKAQEEQA